MEKTKRLEKVLHIHNKKSLTENYLGSFMYAHVSEYVPYANAHNLNTSH
jgi:hypothetical protein